jgi:hypothetical protein
MQHRLPLLMMIIVALTMARPAPADDYPARKPGEWQLTSSTSSGKIPPQVQRVCLDAQTDGLLYKLGRRMGQKACSRFDVHRSGSIVEVDSICRFGASQATSHSTITFSGDTAYRDDTTVRFDPPVGKTGESKTSTDGKWLGLCPADMKPGDLVSQPTPMMPVPLKMNLRDMLEHAE